MEKIVISLFGLFLSFYAVAQEPEYNQVFFENSLMEETWYYSQVSYQDSSFVFNINKKLPVKNDMFFTPGNGLQLRYRSTPGGNWQVKLEYPQWRGKDHVKKADFLVFRVFITGQTTLQGLPEIALALKDTTSSEFKPIGDYIKEFSREQWLEVKIPLTDFSKSGEVFQYDHSKEIVSLLLQQHSITNAEDQIFVDQVELLPAKLPVGDLKVPEIEAAKGYERHVDLSWKQVDPETVKYIKIYRSEDDKNYEPVSIQNPGQANRYADFTGIPGKIYHYKISTLGYDYTESELSSSVKAETRMMNDEELLDMVQEAHFRYYWDGAEPNSGLALENIPGRKNMIATGASGFGIMALIVGAERGFISKKELVERTEKIVSFVETGDRFHGALPHFMDGPAGKVEPFFGEYDDGADLVETSFFMQGLLTLKQYLSKDSPEEERLRNRITEIWEEVEWNWFRKDEDSPYLYWHWSPEHEWHINHRLIGWNETLITYFLAIASPYHGIPANMYYTGWASQDSIAREYRSAWGQTSEGSEYTNQNSYYGVKLDVGVSNGGPLFFTHYSFLGLDPHRMEDKYTNYFENNQAITKINYRYCCENPKNYVGYGKNTWGLTASDGPEGYRAREPKPGMDDGTIAPTGALSSFPYLPEEAMQALKHYYRDLGSFLWGEYGFRDAFNLSEDWVANIFMGLNQAPIVVMIENYRTGLLWDLFMQNEEVQETLEEIKVGD